MKRLTPAEKGIVLACALVENHRKAWASKAAEALKPVACPCGKTAALSDVHLYTGLCPSCIAKVVLARGVSA